MILVTRLLQNRHSPKGVGSTWYLEGGLFARVVLQVWIAAASAAQQRDLSALGSALGISYHTAGRYLDLLEQGCHLFRLEPYIANIGKRLTKAPKIFSEDIGLAVFLSGIRDVEQLEASDRRGAWLESFAVAEIFLPATQLWFWRTSAGAEVDLILEQGKRLLPIEIKWSARPNRSDCRGLESFLGYFRAQAPVGIVGCAASEPFLLTEKIVALPLGWLLT